jgi:hypothetical protein
MVLLYTTQTKADETLWFKNHIDKSNNISLISCSFYNLLFNLESEGMISAANGDVLLRIPKGKYSMDSFKYSIDKAVYIGKKQVSITTKNNKVYIIPIAKVTLNQSLAKLLNINPSLEANSETEIKIKYPTNVIYIHCDLIDSTKVLFNNKYSQILASIELDKPAEKVSHNPYNPLYIPINDNNDYINSIRCWITDSNYDIISTGIYPMNLVINLT